MKKILLFLLFVTSVCQGQIITIPDANLKNILVSANTTNGVAYTNENGDSPSAVIDTNGNGQIELSEALAIKRLNFNYMSSFENGTGIEAFANLSVLSMSGSGVNTLNVTPLINLKELILDNSFLTSLNVSGLANLEELAIDHSYGITALNLSGLTHLKSVSTQGCHNLVSLNLSGATSLNNLVCGDNALTALDVSSNVNLTHLQCGNNLLTSLNVAPLVHLNYLSLAANQLANLNVAALTELETLNCSANNLTNVNVATLTQLKDYNCSNNPIQSLGIEGLHNMRYLNCDGTNLTGLDVTMQPNLEVLYCGGFNFSALTTVPSITKLSINGATLPSLDLSLVPNLTDISINATNLTSIDLSHNAVQIQYLTIVDNPNLEFLNIKNGSDNMYIDNIMGCPNLVMVCCDPGEISQEDLTMEIYGNNPYVQVSSYCSFTPGGVYNTIAGHVRFDQAGDGCNETDLPFAYANISNDDGGGAQTASTMADGSYRFYRQLGTFTLTPHIENPSYFNVSPNAATVSFNTVDNQMYTRDFCITANGIHPDAEIVIVPSGPARPGFDAEYDLIYHNKGNQNLSGYVTLNFDGARTDFVSANPNVFSQTTGTLTWDYANLLPFETRAIHFVLNLNGPMEIPPLNQGDLLGFYANLNYQIPDVASYNANFELQQTVTNSMDPNDKTCLEGNSIAPETIGDYVHYNINFENTGNAPAVNIVVKDAIDLAKFDITTLQVMYASHPVMTRINGNIVEFIFEHIELPGAAGNNKGNVMFKIKTRPNLVLGNSISNKAEIFFDYNFPIETNEATSTFTLLKNRDFTPDATIGVYPNPTKNKVTVKANSSIQSLQLFDIQGRLLQSSAENANETSMDIAAQQNGVYLLEIKTEKGSKVEKLVKE